VFPPTPSSLYPWQSVESISTYCLLGTFGVDASALADRPLQSAPRYLRLHFRTVLAGKFDVGLSSRPTRERTTRGRWRLTRLSIFSIRRIRWARPCVKMRTPHGVGFLHERCCRSYILLRQYVRPLNFPLPECRPWGTIEVSNQACAQRNANRVPPAPRWTGRCAKVRSWKSSGAALPGLLLKSITLPSNEVPLGNNLSCGFTRNFSASSLHAEVTAPPACEVRERG